jgi:hypothetical protein
MDLCDVGGENALHGVLARSRTEFGCKVHLGYVQAMRR